MTEKRLRTLSALRKAVSESQEVLHFEEKETERERETERKDREICHCTRMSFQCDTDAPPAKTTVVSTCPFSQHHVYVHVHLHMYSI